MLTDKEKDNILDRALAGTVNDPEIGPIDGTIQDAAYQVSRGIRPLVLLGHVRPDPITLLRAYNRLQYLGGQYSGMTVQPIPIVALRKDEACADAGFAARQWVVETLAWIHDNAPQPHLDRLLGLLLGYSPDAIAAHDEVQSGKLFPDTVTALLEQESNPQAHAEGDHRTEERSPLHLMQSAADGRTQIDRSRTEDMFDPC